MSFWVYITAPINFEFLNNYKKEIKTFDKEYYLDTQFKIIRIWEMSKCRI